MIYYDHRPTSLGTLLVATGTNGLCFAGLGNLPDLIADLKSRFDDSYAEDAERPADDLSALVRFIEEGAPLPVLALDIRGTDFQQKVWRGLMQIPAGTTKTYQELAAQIGHPTAVRAVASACARNNIAIVIPCHRIIRSDGGMGGYYWGVERKKALLAQEARRTEGIAVAA